MNRSKLESLKTHIDEIINSLGYEIIEIEWISAKDRILKLFIDFNSIQLDAEDNQKAIDIDDCVTVNKAIEGLNILEESIKSNYHLEVCSPGVERPIRYIKDFQRWSGHLVFIQLKESQDKQRKVQGKIGKIDNDLQEVTINLEQNDEPINIAMTNIQKANLIYQWS